jgi:uncharacterized membrane protein
MRLVVLALFLVAANLCVAQQYYADLTVDLLPDGIANISSTSNHASLRARSTDSLTSKRGAYWLFNLTLPGSDTFSAYVFEIRLPKNAQINYLKSEGSFRIIDKAGRMAVRGTGSNESLAVVIQYNIVPQTMQETSLESPVNANFPTLMVIVAVTLCLAAFMLYIRRKNAAPQEVISHDPNLLTERQNAILQALKEAASPVNQSLICERLKLPKSSVSRNVDSLVQMGLVKKTRNGMSTMVSVNAKVNKPSVL